MLDAILLIFAALGWLTTIIGAVLQHRGAATLTEPNSQGVYTISTSEKQSRWGLTLAIMGASVGAAGTILAVLAGEARV